MNDKNKSNKKSVPKPPPRNLVTIEISIKTNQNTGKNEIIYLDGGGVTNGDVEMDTEKGTKDARVIFFSQLGPLVITLRPITIKGDVSEFKIGDNIKDPNQAIIVKIPKKGKPQDMYKYSVVLFTDSEIVVADPRIRIAN